MADDFFAPLPAGERAAGGSANGTAPKPVPIVPVPGDAPQCNWRHPKHGEPVAMWPYHDADGRLVGYAARVEYAGADGKLQKDVLPITYCRVEHANGHYHAWRARALPAPRPLYRLSELLAVAAAAPVIVAEGEKKADVVPKLFPSYIGTTSMGGAGAARMSDWAPLAGRNVVVWPDHDEAGKRYADDVAALATAAGAATVAIITVPSEWPEGWDLADPLPEDVTLEMLAELLHSPVKPEPRAAAEDGEAEIARLARLPTNTYERERRAAAERLGYRAPILDKLVEAARGKADPASADNAGQGRRLSLRDVEPWPDPVDGGALLDEIAGTVRRYVVLDKAAADAAALWVVHTYALDAAYVSPRLAITSPEKRCGKTTLLTVLRALVTRALATANMTTATIFRVIEAARPTLLIDEADSFLGDADEMRGVINAGHCRATAIVLRTVETRDGYEVREFALWGAVALAAIGRLPGTIEDRAIKVAMRRRRPDEAVERLRLDRLDGLTPLARRAARWTTDQLDTLRAADPDIPAELHDRAADNWRPLLAVADAGGGGWPERARRAAASLAREGADDAETARTMLLADVKAAFDAKASDRLASEEIIAHLTELEDRPWPEFRGGKAITKAQLAKLLKPLRISSGTIRLENGKTPKGYHRSAFEDAFARYLSPEKNATTPQAKDSAPFGENRNATSGNGVAFQNPQKPKDAAGCGVVADQSGDEGVNGKARPSGGDTWALEI
jgi:hypothetical protein